LFFQIPEGALATLEAAAAVFASVIGLAERTNAIPAFVTNIPFVGLGKLFPAALTGDIDHSFTI
jgi:hypothetical protein